MRFLSFNPSFLQVVLFPAFSLAIFSADQKVDSTQNSSHKAQFSGFNAIKVKLYYILFAQVGLDWEQNTKNSAWVTSESDFTMWITRRIMFSSVAGAFVSSVTYDWNIETSWHYKLLVTSSTSSHNQTSSNNKSSTLMAIEGSRRHLKLINWISIEMKSRQLTSFSVPSHRMRTGWDNIDFFPLFWALFSKERIELETIVALSVLR